MAKRMRIVITGAAGNLGSKLRAHLESTGEFDLVLTDLNGGGDPNIIEADLSDLAATWPSLLDGAEVVVHLAANASPSADWPSLQSANVDATLALYDSALNRGVRRIIFASTNQVLNGYRRAAGPIPSADLGLPTNFYGATKLVGERVGYLYAIRYGMSVINLRIGTVNRGDNPPPSCETLWDQWKWLSNDDFCRAIELAIKVRDVTFANVILTSHNAGAPWDIEETREVLGFIPADRTEPIPPRISDQIRSLSGRIKRLIFGFN